jgi:hypothetical protein
MALMVLDAEGAKDTKEVGRRRVGKHDAATHFDDELQLTGDIIG